VELKNELRGRISEYVEKYPNAKYIAGKRPWEVKCDIALPCTQNELNEEEAKTLVANGCVFVAEGANMPTMPDAVIVFKSKIIVCSRKAANAGGALQD
jgi:glutamate dehydrogenase (NADP+)